MKERMRKALGFLGLIEDEYGEYGASTPTRPFTDQPGQDEEPEWSTPTPTPSARAFPTTPAGAGGSRPVPAARPAPVSAGDAPRLRPVPSGRIRTLSAASDEDVAVIAPLSYDESRRITDHLRSHRPVLLNVMDLEPDVARRVIDFTSGTIYALRATIERLAPGAYLISFPDSHLAPDARMRLRATNYRAPGSA